MSLNRRETLKILAISPVAVAAAATGCAPSEEHEHPSQAQAANGDRLLRDGRTHEAPMFFTEHEYDTVHKLVDYIIPADDVSGSATDAGVPEFIDFIALDLDPREAEELQTRLRGGLAWLDYHCVKQYEKPFLEADDAQCRAVLDQIAYPDDAEPGMEPGMAFFIQIRDLTATGFYTSRMGIEDLQYQGNTFRAEWDGVPQEVLDHVGVTYADWQHVTKV